MKLFPGFGIIRDEQKARHARDQQINDQASKAKMQMKVDNIDATLARQDALDKAKGESSQSPPPQKTKGGPSAAPVVAVIAAQIAADRIHQARNTPYAGPVPPTTIHIDPIRGGKKPF